MATGFQPADYLARLEVVGRTGRTLREYWAGEPHAFLGITVPEFPNFFILYGPGTNGGEIVTMLESQSEYAVRAMKRMRRERVTAIEVRPSFDRWWNRWLQSKMRGTSWTMSNNYFKAPTGKVVTQWPIGCTVYRALTKVFGRVSETTRRRSPEPEPASSACHSSPATHVRFGRGQGFGAVGGSVGGQQLEELAVGVADEQRQADVALLDDLAAVLDDLRRGRVHVVDRDRQVGEPGVGHRPGHVRGHRARRRVVR